MISAPGRVNLIGEHIDYHGLPVLPMALRRSIRVTFEPRTDARIIAESEHYGRREFAWTAELQPVARGDWENYLRAAAQAISGKWGAMNGLEARIESDLPAAAGLSSSSALLVAFTLALLAANQCKATFEELMEILPEGEYFVGTRGGGMDHAAALASRAGCASLVHFVPLSVQHIPIPADWAFLVAHSLVTAEKSGAVRERYNAVRAAGDEALRDLGYESYAEATSRDREGAVLEAAHRSLTVAARNAYLHVVTEARRVAECVDALRTNQPKRFGQLLLDSHASLRDRLQVSLPALDRLVEAATTSGALGARLTGAGFGGCAVVLCRRADLDRVRSGLIERFYGGDPVHIFDAEPGAGAVHS
jgi:galactokinase